MATRVGSQRDLEDFLDKLVPRQGFRITFAGSHSSAGTRAVGLVNDGLLTLSAANTALLRTIGRRGFWGEERKVFEFQLTDDFHQPEASRLAAEALWPGVAWIETV